MVIIGFRGEFREILLIEFLENIQEGRFALLTIRADSGFRSFGVGF